MRVAKIIETCLYTVDLEAAEGFYADLLGLKLVRRDEGRCLAFRCGDSVLLIFNPK